MRAQLLRRLVNLEIRKQEQRSPRKAPFPRWLIEEWQAQNSRLTITVSSTGLKGSLLLVYESRTTLSFETPRSADHALRAAVDDRREQGSGVAFTVQFELAVTGSLITIGSVVLRSFGSDPFAGSECLIERLIAGLAEARGQQLALHSRIDALPLAGN